jgi:anti-sigma-K factor RskA
MMEHQEYQELLTLHALGALDASDRLKVEDHLQGCSDCRSELIQLRDTTALLAHAAPPAEPSTEVRTRILDEVRREPRRGQTASETSASVVPFRARTETSAWRNMLRLAAAIAFVALLIGVIVLWLRDVRTRRELARLSQQLEQQNGELARNREALAHQREALDLLNSPGMKKMELAGTQTAKTARGTFVYDRSTGRAMLLTAGLPAAPPGMAYEVWFIPKGHSPMPGKTFNVDAGGQAMMMDQVPPEARENAVIAITLEPKSGSASPTGAIYLSSPAL